MASWRVVAIAVLAVAGCGKKEPGSAGPVAVDLDPGAAVPADAAVAPSSPASTDPQVAAGAALWGTYCKLCHGARGEGYAADQAPSLITDTFLATASDEFLRAGIVRGRPGTAMAGYGKAVGGPLDEAAVDQLIAFLRDGRPPPAPLPAGSITGDVRRGQVVYDQRCRECHGLPLRRGEGPHLANAVFLETASDAFIRAAIVQGRPGTKMVPFEALLPPADIDAVVAYIRTWRKTSNPPPGQNPPPVVERPKQIVINPRGKPPAFTLRDGRFVPADQVKKALDQKRRIILLDARAPSDWMTMRIPGSIPTPYYDKTTLEGIPNDGTWIVAYCACPHHASGEVVDALRAKGYKNTAVLDEGVLVWDQRGYPIFRAPGAPKSMPHDHHHHGHAHDHGHGHGHGH